MLAEIVEAPYISTSSLKNLGFLTAAEFITTLSTPILSSLSTSSTFLIPPPDETFTKIFFDIFSIILNKTSLLYNVATTS